LNILGINQHKLELPHYQLSINFIQKATRAAKATTDSLKLVKANY